ncbi:hypothetical protein FisN_7Lh233 [Fistulifera solaris]|uniref:DUF547 domain-containing protein n=1 Tax=Fistulifera solaris TaxID=1519565 RepID=A0A1Z5JRW3_FISSO|nr:hypothetical protein FisN_7Lh233 [Fistulifera solaris]|eukprot:GAX16511.1 hypothetical protein FisN_7Lh233 [Fistulifera solaris]
MKPSLVLYTSPTCCEESDELKDFLVQGGFDFEEKRVLVVPVLSAVLKLKWGPEASLPVLRYGKDHWIAARDHESLRQLYVDQLLISHSPRPSIRSPKTVLSPKEISFSPNNGNLKKAYSFRVPSFCPIEDTTSTSASSTIEIEFVPSKLEGSFQAVEEKDSSSQLYFKEEEQYQRTTNEDDEDSQEYMEEMSVMERGDEASDDEEETLIATSSRVSHEATKLHTMPPVPELMRQLLISLHHETYQDRQGQTHYYVKGRDAVRMLRVHLEKEGNTPNVSDFDAITYGKQLLQMQVLQNYTPDEDEFEKCLLVLQPFWTPQVLNSFMIWPEDRESTESAEEVLHRLSKQMDALTNDPIAEDDETLWDALEVAVCELQMVEFPHESPEFALNLYNLIVRHAAHKKSNNEWPTSLESIEKMWQSIGYNVGSEWIDLMTLQTMLLGQQKRVEKNRDVMNQLLRRGRRTESYDGFSPCYYNSVALDPRYIFAMTWGCQSSPAVSTLCHNLEQSLQQAAERYCRKYVKISKQRVVLPTLISWYCKSFGATHATQVLKRVRSYLTQEQDNCIKKYKLRNPQFEIVFADSSNFKWERRLSDNTEEGLSGTDEIHSQTTATESLHDAYMSSHRRRVEQLRASRPSPSQTDGDTETQTRASSGLWGELIDEEPPSEKDYDDPIDYNDEEVIQFGSRSLLGDLDSFRDRGALTRGRSLYLTMRKEISALTLDIAFHDEPGFQRLQL